MAHRVAVTQNDGQNGHEVTYGGSDTQCSPLYSANSQVKQYTRSVTAHIHRTVSARVPLQRRRFCRVATVRCGEWTAERPHGTMSFRRQPKGRHGKLRQVESYLETQ